MVPVTMLVQNGCLFSGVSLCQEVFLLANTWWRIMHPEKAEKLFEFQVVSPDGQPVKGGAGMAITPVKSMTEVKQTELILIPPYLHTIRNTLPAFSSSVDWLRFHHKKGATLAGLCTGSFVLATTGLLDGKKATTNWQFARSFRNRFPDVDLQTQDILTIEDRLICTGATTAILDFCLYVLKKYGSEELAENCARAMLIDPNRKSQAPYVMFDGLRNHNDVAVMEAQDYLDEHFADNIVVDQLAKNVGLSSRHFQRRFKEATGESPLSYLQKIRIEKAKIKLSSTRLPFSEITWAVGYEDVNSFRKIFKRHTSLSPKEYRLKFEKPSRYKSIT